MIKNNYYSLARIFRETSGLRAKGITNKAESVLVLAIGKFQVAVIVKYFFSFGGLKLSDKY